MKTMLYILLTSIVALAPITSVAAQDVQPKVIQRPKVQADTNLLPVGTLERFKLTKDQNEKYGKLDAEFKEKAKAATEKYENDIKTLRDREQFKDAQDKLRADIAKARENGLDNLTPILTEEQKVLLKQIQIQQPKVQPNPGGIIVRPQPIGGSSIGPVFTPAIQKKLQLTAEQQKQIAEIHKELEAKIMKVLSDEQKKTLEQIKKPVIRPLPLQIQPIPRIQIQPQILPVLPKKEP